MKKVLLTVFLLGSLLWGRAQSGCAFFVEQGGGISFSNNIIIHNGSGNSNVNVGVPLHNLVTDTTGVFRDDVSDFLLMPHSPALDAGINSGVTWSMDMRNSVRISNGTVDLGAYEHYVSPPVFTYVVWIKDSGNLTLCNNIVIKNPSHTGISNDSAITSVNNFLNDSAEIFKNETSDFTLWSHSPAIDAGTDACNLLTEDMSGVSRVLQTAIDYGAFEYDTSGMVLARNYAVELTLDDVTMTLCNNIITNHKIWIDNTNLSNVPDNNIVFNDDSLFVDMQNDYRPSDSSQAIDHGSDACNTVEHDLAGNNRSTGAAIDVGAFEQYVPETEDSSFHYLVFNAAGHQMQFCNNLIVNNGVHDSVVNGILLDASNFVSDSSDVFRDNETDFRIVRSPLVLDAGNTDCASGWSLDLEGKRRIYGNSVDIGAFEVYVSSLMDTIPSHVVYEKPQHQLQLCNNIIVHNPSHDTVCNVVQLDGSNYLNDGVQVLRNALYDFRPLRQSPVEDAGSNSCAVWSLDMEGEERIAGASVEIGAFEIAVDDSTTTGEIVIGHGTVVVGGGVIGGNGTGHGSGYGYSVNATVCAYSGSSFYLCNNIIINNNIYVYNVYQNDTIDTLHNILTDTDSLFTDNQSNYYPLGDSRAINLGRNLCNALSTDLARHRRVYQNVIDMGAFEQFDPNDNGQDTSLVILQENGHHLQLCNNIIVNNPTHTLVSNIDSIPPSNLLSDSIPIFRNSIFDFTPLYVSPAVNHGENDCSSWAHDLQGKARVYEETVDIGAFEQYWEQSQSEDTVYAVQQSVDTSLLYLCNNIIINNGLWTANTDIEDLSLSNILEDNDTLFVNSTNDYRPRDTSIAVNRGNNECNVVEKDLAHHRRVMGDTIDIGAFEVFSIDALDGPDCYAVYETDSSELVLCNNIIVNNPNHTAQTNRSHTGGYNLIADTAFIFRDQQFDFIPLANSQVVNVGNNDCFEFQRDLESNGRVTDDIIDLGAFEQTRVVTVSDTGSIVNQTDTFGFDLCNNIIINNCYWTQNVPAMFSDSHNILIDNDSVFIDNENNYLPRENSIAVNAGDNDCNTQDVDLQKRPRILSDTIEIGAYELYVNDDNETPDLYTILQTDTSHSHRLQLYNNIVIYNDTAWAEPTNEVSIDEHNMLHDQTNVFVDELSDFSLATGSLAINVGDNNRVQWSKDLQSKARISCLGIVDLGAYEYDLSNIEVSIVVTEEQAENCMDSYILLTANSNAMHYHWGHSNLDTNEVRVMPLTPTYYTVTASNEGGCYSSSTLLVMPLIPSTDTVEITANQPSSTGKTFWVSFMKNHFRTPTLSLVVSAEQACSGVVRNPRTGWSTSFHVADHATATVSIPAAQAYCASADVVADLGLIVEANDTISLCAANFNNNSFDASNVFPANSLNTDYIIQTYTPTTNSEFVIVATENNTTVEITPTRQLQGGHAAHVTFSIMLQKGQTYLGMSSFGGARGDLSGTVIHALNDAKIAVFNGNVCANVPASNSYTDHLYEQAVPVNYWGQTFAITTSEGQNFDVVRVTAQRNETQLRRNGVLIATLNAQQSYEFQISSAEGSCYLECSEPVGVYQYIAGAQQGNVTENSDPSMIWISPLEQKGYDVVFSTFQTESITQHYVNIVTSTANLGSIRLDGAPVTAVFSPVNGQPNFSFARVALTHGAHRLNSPNGFIAHVYGLGYHESYGYSTGSVAVPLEDQLLVNGQPVLELAYDHHFCPYDSILFSTLVNYECDSIVWNFGDQTPTQNGLEVYHNFTSAGNYYVTATLFIEQNGVTYCSSLYAGILVADGQTFVYQDTVCQGYHYQNNGFDVYANTSGQTTYTRQDDVEGSNCGNSYVLELTVFENIIRIFDTICVHNTYQSNGFNISADSVGIIFDTLSFSSTQTGCDSLLILELVVTPTLSVAALISGDSLPRVGYSATYEIETDVVLQNLVWNVESPAVILSSQGGNSIIVDFPDDADSIAISVSGQNACGSVSLTKIVYPLSDYHIQIYDTICDNESVYDGYGFHIVQPSAENSVFVHTDTASSGVDSTTVLTLIIKQSYRVELFDTICQGEHYAGYGFDVPVDSTIYPHTIVETVRAPSLRTGCDSVTILTLTVNPVDTVRFNDTICQGETFTDHGFDISADSTIYPHTIVETVRAPSLRTGCDSITILTLTIYPIDTVRFNETICQGETYAEHGFDVPADSTMTPRTIVQTADSTTTPHVVVQTVRAPSLRTGCDSITILTLTVNPVDTVRFNETICQGETFTGHGFDIPADSTTTPHTIVQTVRAPSPRTGCDSITILTLTVNPVDTVYFNETICQGETYAGHGFHVPADSTMVPQTMVQTVRAPSLRTGCDSITILTLTVNSVDTVRFNETICQGETYAGHGFDIPVDSTIYPHTIVQTVRAPSLRTGCDSITILTLTVNSVDTVRFNETICQSEIFTGLGFDIPADSTIYPRTIVQTVRAPSLRTGCDSVTILTLTVLPTSVSEFNAITCNSYIWNETTYEHSDDYVQHLENTQGCDSVVTLHLTVNRDTAVYYNGVVCQGNTYSGYGFDIPADSSMTPRTIVQTVRAPSLRTGCDSITILTLTIHPIDTVYFNETICQGETYAEHGFDIPVDSTMTPHVIVETVRAPSLRTGCDSITILTLTVNPVDTVRFNETICQGEPFTGHGFDIPVDSTMTPHVIVETVRAPSLRTGCDSITILTLTVNSVDTVRFNETICQGEHYVGHGFDVPADSSMTPRTIVQTVRAPSLRTGCDSITILTLTVNPVDTVRFNETICQSEIFTGHGFDVPADSTIYPRTIVQTVRAPSLRTGCDSITILTLTIHPHTYSTVTDTALLPLMPHHYNGYVFHNDTANCQLVVSNHLGCDSIITYSLYVQRFKLATADSTVCSKALPIIWNGIQFTQPATRICTLAAHNGIDSILTMTLYVNPSPQIAANLMHVNCHGTSTGAVNAVVSQGTQPYLYQWMQGSTNIGTTAQIANRPAGAYHLHVTDAAGCTADSTFTIQTLHTQLQAGAIAQTQVVCEGDDIALLTGTVASGGDNGHYEWQTSENGTDFTAATGNGSAQDYQPEEIIGLRHYRRAWISTSCGTAYSNIVTITVNPILYDTVTATVCQNEPYNGQGFDIPAEATNAPGIIVQTGRAPSLRTGCDSVTTLLLTVHPTYHFDEELTLCDYDLPFTFRGTTFEPGTPAHSTTDFTYPTIDGCDSVYTLDLTIIETDLQIESLNDFCDEVQADLRVETTLQNYIWNTGETTDQIHILHSGDYAVTASTGSCEATATIQVPFCELTMPLPNAITPANHDGLNDYFCLPERIQKLILDGSFEIYIYNRWGEEVFHSTDKNFKWDGSYQNQTFHSNVYTYKIKCNNLNGRPLMFIGSITVL